MLPVKHQPAPRLTFLKHQIRGGTSPIFSSPSRARALNVEPGRARACPNFPRASFEPELSTNKNANIRVRAYFEPIGKLGSSSLEPGAYLLRAQNQARAFEPEPRLVPPLLLWIFAEWESHPLLLSGRS